MLKGGVHGKEGMCGEGGGLCVAKGGMHNKRGLRGRGHVWQGGCMAGGMRGRRDSYCSGRYASYWNAFLFCMIKFD